MTLIDLDGNTWDGTKLNSKYKPVYDSQGRNEMMGVTLGWLCDAPEFDLEKNNAEIRNKAIDDFVEKIELEISESIIWDILVSRNENSSFGDTSDKIVDYVIDEIKNVAEHLKEGSADNEVQSRG